MWWTLVQLLHYILKCLHLEWRWLFCPFRYMFIQTIRLMSKLLASLMRNYFPKRPSGAPLHNLSELYDVPVGLVPPPPPILKLCIALFAVAEGGCCLISDDLSCSFRILEIDFPHFSLTCFNILSWNFTHDVVLLYYRSSSSVVNLRQFLWELSPFRT